jgi:hypothetical protein
MLKTNKLPHTIDYLDSNGLIARLSQLRDNPNSLVRKEYNELIELLKMIECSTILADIEIRKNLIQKLMLHLYSIFKNNHRHNHKPQAEEIGSEDYYNHKLENTIQKLITTTDAIYDINREIIQTDTKLLDYMLISDPNISKIEQQLLLKQIQSLINELAKPQPDIAIIAAANPGLQLGLLGQAYVDDKILTPRSAIQHFNLNVENEVEQACDNICKKYLPLTPKPEPKQHEELLKDKLRQHIVGDILIRKFIPEAHRTEADRKMSSVERSHNVIAKYESDDEATNKIVKEFLFSISELLEKHKQLDKTIEQNTQELEENINSIRSVSSSTPSPTRLR